MTTSVASNELQRKILFFRIDIGVDDGGVPLTYNPVPTLSAIEALPFVNGDDSRYQLQDDGSALCLINYTNQNRPRVQFCRVRRTGLPQLETAGHVTDLNIEPETGLLEAAHLMFFPGNIVGAEYNHFGPRISRLGTYLLQKSGLDYEKIIFRALLRGDASAQLDRLTDLRLIEIAIVPAFAEVTRQSDESLADALAANGRAIQATPKILELKLQPQANERQSFLRSKRERLKQIVAIPEFRQGAQKLQVRGKCSDSERVETIELLGDQLVSTQSIVRLNDRGRALDSNSAFDAIEESYQQLKGELELVAGMSL